MSLESEKLHGQRAKELLDNPVWEEIWAGMDKYLNTRMMGCNTAKDPEQAADIVRCKQLLVGIRREAVKIAENGQVAEIRMSEIEQSKIQHVFRR